MSILQRHVMYCKRAVTYFTCSNVLLHVLPCKYCYVLLSFIVKNVIFLPMNVPLQSSLIAVFLIQSVSCCFACFILKCCCAAWKSWKSKRWRYIYRSSSYRVDCSGLVWIFCLFLFFVLFFNMIAIDHFLNIC